MGRVAVAMSGGVDSSVAALLMVEAGHDVVGVMARLWTAPSPCAAANRCCTAQSVDDARRVAALLGIPFYLIDHQQEFKHTVVDHFVAEYSRGRTPNPCLLCNQHIRFGVLLRRALGMGATHLATGHYARVQPGDGRMRLLRGVDASKDQSYALSALSQEQLAHVLFPLGGMTKPQVRAVARARGLPVAERTESQDLCFLPGADYREFVASNATTGVTPGPMYDEQGRQVGEHRGLAYYTVGQRRGLGVATGMPLYVLAIDAQRNAITVGSQAALLRHGLTASNVTYIAGQAPVEPFRCRVQLRYRTRDWPATVTPLPGSRAGIAFHEPQRPVSPGQAAVFYHGDEVLGCGVID